MSSLIRVFAGIEGGGTKTQCTLVSEFGEILAEETTGPTNPWLLGNVNESGFSVAAKRINLLIRKSLNRLSVENDNDENSNIRIVDDKEYELVAAGLCLSGAGTKSVHESIINEMHKLDVKYKVYVGNDTLAPIFTAFENGGLVIISGTGSKCVLINPLNESEKLESFDDVKVYSSGGWGNLLGDEGSAYWIAQRAIKYVIDYYDNFLLDIDYSNYDVTIIDAESQELRYIIFDHFNVNSFDDLLPFFYSDFKKDFIAGLTVKLANVADNKIVIKKIFEDSGYELARHILAIQPKIDKKLLSNPEGLPIVCAGSVFKSWSLIKPGFVRCIEHRMNKFSNLTAINLVCIKDHSTLGAALLAARVHDGDIKLGQHFDLSMLTSKLDHFYVNKMNKIYSSNGTNHHSLTHHHYSKHPANLNSVNIDELVLEPA